MKIGSARRMLELLCVDKPSEHFFFFCLTSSYGDEGGFVVYSLAYLPWVARHNLVRAGYVQIVFLHHCRVSLYLLRPRSPL